MNVLFWNTSRNSNKYNINNCIIELVLDKNCDLIVLAEYDNDITYLCEIINKASIEEYCPIPNNGGCDKITGLIKKKIKVDVLREQMRYQIVKLEAKGYKLIVAMIHNISKLHALEDTQEENLRNLHSDIRIEEDTYNTTNSLIVGDLNVNPFERSCISASALHAIPFLQEVNKPTRTIQGREYDKFYNPTWKFYGNREIPYTSYYYSSSDVTNYYWHIFDQVIVRPILTDAFDDDSLEVISKTQNHNLLRRNNRPDNNKYSDHLPLFFALKEEKIK